MSALKALSRIAGIAPSYFDISGHLHVTSTETRMALLNAMGFNVHDEESAFKAWQQYRAQKRREILLPCVVLQQNGAQPRHYAPFVQVNLDSPTLLHWQLILTLENGDVAKWDGEKIAIGRRTQLPLPIALPLGYHRLEATLALQGKQSHATQTVIVTPGHCWSVSADVQKRHAVGVWTNVYTLRSQHNSGIGDLADVRALIQPLAQRGADFIGLSPLHAIFNTRDNLSPYSPVSRLYRNPIYIALHDVAEWRTSKTAQEYAASPANRAMFEQLRNAPYVDYEQVWRYKRAVLNHLYATYCEENASGTTPRAQAFANYCARQGSSLVQFATFSAMADDAEKKGEGRDCRQWRQEYQAFASPAVQSWMRSHAEEINFYCYLQFVLDEQLLACSVLAQRSGMRIGIYQDMAVGIYGGGADAWSFSQSFVAEAEVGAPPDPYAAQGQNWASPPLHPLRLREQSYAYWQQVVRQCMAHSGALRIDHVMGLLRLFWIPKGLPASTGAYVRYPFEDLLGIVALESWRHQTIVIGEDLGTVPPGFRERLRKWHVLSTQVLLFEKDMHYGYKVPQAYSETALLTATTHDMAPLAGFWRSSDIATRQQIGILSDDEAHADFNMRQHDKYLLQCALHHAGLLDNTEVHATHEQTLVKAAHCFLQQAPAPLVALALDDLAGEHSSVNLPGTTNERYPNWMRKMSHSIETLLCDDADLSLVCEHDHRPAR